MGWQDYRRAIRVILLISLLITLQIIYDPLAFNQAWQTEDSPQDICKKMAVSTEFGTGKVLEQAASRDVGDIIVFAFTLDEAYVQGCTSVLQGACTKADLKKFNTDTGSLTGVTKPCASLYHIFRTEIKTDAAPFGFAFQEIVGVHLRRYAANQAMQSKEELVRQVNASLDESATIKKARYIKSVRVGLK